MTHSQSLAINSVFTDDKRGFGTRVDNQTQQTNRQQMVPKNRGAKLNRRRHNMRDRNTEVWRENGTETLVRKGNKVQVNHMRV